MPPLASSKAHRGVPLSAARELIVVVWPALWSVVHLPRTRAADSNSAALTVIGSRGQAILVMACWRCVEVGGLCLLWRRHEALLVLDWLLRTGVGMVDVSARAFPVRSVVGLWLLRLQANAEVFSGHHEEGFVSRPPTSFSQPTSILQLPYGYTPPNGLDYFQRIHMGVRKLTGWAAGCPGK